MTKVVSRKSICEGILKINKGGGGSNTTKNGKKFEDLTNYENISTDYTKTFFTKDTKKVNNYYLSKKFDDKTIVFVSQNGFKTYMKKKYNKIVFRCPDEAYIIEYNTSKKIIIKILEKKIKIVKVLLKLNYGHLHL